MKALVAPASCVVLLLLLAPATATRAGDLSLDERVAAQEAIERIHHAHRLGTDTPFEQAIPREVLESKVETSLKQSAALETFWNTPITAGMLERELQRIGRSTRLPDRLRELFAALGRDPVVIQETLARAALASRLARDFYASDARFHASSRQEAEAIRDALAAGTLDPNDDDPRRVEVELVRDSRDGRLPDGSHVDELRPAPRFALSDAAFDRGRRRLSGSPHEPRTVDESRDAFHVRVLLEADDVRLRVASYRVAKTPWDEWWNEVSAGLDAASVATVASPGVPVPVVRGGTDRVWDPAGASVPCDPDDTWTPGNLPLPRNGHTAVWTGSVMVIWGGWDGDSSLESGGRYDPVIDAWTPTSIVNAPSPRSGHTAVWTGEQMVVWGGAGSDTGGRYDPVADSWTATTVAGAPTPRTDHTALWTGSEMLIWGGHDGGSYQEIGGRYDPAADAWTAMSTANAPSGRTDHTAVWTGSEMLIWGGYVVADALDTGGRYDPASDSWTTITMTSAPSPRRDHSAVWTGSLMLVWGGRASPPGNQALDSGGRYDPATDSWTPTATENAPTPRHDHTAVWTGSRMLVWGGWGWGGDYSDDGGRYDPAADAWLATSPTGAPSPRTGHSVVWTGSLMLVWGGSGGGRLLDSGGRYDPSADLWTATSTGNLPSARYSHTAVWTGNVMLVWGGEGFGEYADVGGRYDPLIDGWTAMSTSNAPTPRVGHRAVWTGDLMLVWGGYTSPATLDTGGRYDPVTDTWSPVSTTGAPSPRQLPEVVWTGDEMLIWGGFADSSGSTPLATGGRYDPATDGWSGITIQDAPSARAAHVAVWTGEAMLIWGGLGDSTVFDTGGRYDPATDTWTPTSTVGAPPPAVQSTAVWTGSRMMVWGGFDLDGTLDSGAQYDPATDAWTPTSAVGAPSPRRGHTAVWTGNRVLLWGGVQGFGQQAIYVDTGGRYDPASDAWVPTSTVAAPSPRAWHTAVWTGSHMTVWGGTDFTEAPVAFSSGGRYALGHSQDDDGDGYAECSGDCNDGDPSVSPGALEVCDGLDNDCDFLVDDGAAPVEVASLAFESKSTLSWQAGSPGQGTVYDVARGLIGELPVGSGAGEVCLGPEPGDSVTDPAVPLAGAAYWYLVRGRNDCGTGSYGTQSGGEERTSAVCP